jgi:hypothetical protein
MSRHSVHSPLLIAFLLAASGVVSASDALKTPLSQRQVPILLLLDGQWYELGVCTVVEANGQLIITAGTQPNPPVPVPPGPNPTPTPTPDGAFGLSKLSYINATQVKQPARAKSQELAKNFTAEAAQIAAGARSSIEESQASLKEVNRATLGDLRVDWLDWFVAWQAAVGQANGEGKIKTLADYQAAYEATATGLQAVK